MRETILCGNNEVRLEIVADARLMQATHALVAVPRAPICSSDRWPYDHATSARRAQGHGEALIARRTER